MQPVQALIPEGIREYQRPGAVVEQLQIVEFIGAQLECRFLALHRFTRSDFAHILKPIVELLRLKVLIGVQSLAGRLPFSGVSVHVDRQSISVNENGKKRTVTRLQAMVKRMVAAALQGDQKATLTLVEILRRTGRFEQVDAGSLLPDDYEAILDSYVQKRQSRAAKQVAAANKEAQS